ncbi:polyprenyl diphosphate synthase [Streptomyces sp. NPDC006739]|uniref:polyprenyl diphosphate synthase n=1 Tax=Streptomyces sp. NPDC006739 TaxID=3364763 RepID=UPI0036830100
MAGTSVSWGPHPSGGWSPLWAPGRVPAHVALIVDGNGRWATHRGLARNAGHAAAVPRLLDTIDGAAEAGIRYLSFYLFSTENWLREPEEVARIFEIIGGFVTDNQAALHAKGMRALWCGRRDRVPDALGRTLAGFEQLTRDNRTMDLVFCVDYGARDELLRAAAELAREAADGRLNPDRIDVASLTSRLYQPGVPDVDLLIRTSGERRISNFLLWQCAYAELYFTDVLFPDFDRFALWEAVADYAGRERRFGKAGAA